MANSPRDNNRVTGVIGSSNVDGTAIPVKADATTQRLYVTATTDVNTTSIVQDGTKKTAGTNVAVQLVATATPCTKVSIYAYSTNSDTVAVGTSTVVAESNSSGTKTGRGEQLLQGAATVVTISDASKIWIASAVNGDGVSYIAYL